MVAIGPRILPMFRSPSGTLIPGNVDSQGRLISSVIPFVEPDVTFSAVDQQSGGPAASITISAIPGVQRIVTYISASLSATAISSQFRVTLTDSISGLRWAGELMVPANNSYTITAKPTIVGSVGASLTLAFNLVAAVTENQSLFISGINYAP